MATPYDYLQPRTTNLILHRSALCFDFGIHFNLYAILSLYLKLSASVIKVKLTGVRVMFDCLSFLPLNSGNYDGMPSIRGAYSTTVVF